MLIKIAGFAVILIAAILAYTATKPSTFRVQRSARINASPEKIFPLINDFHSWVSWSPYENRDPDMRRTYGTITGGKGATYAWDGNKNVGQGSMEIVVASPPSNLTIKLDFMKPFEAHNTAEFTLEPVGDSTVVTWAMDGPQPYVAKVMSLFFNMDKMIGKDFEAGLANLKTAVEK
ncbi:MAG: polyketide cyclase [Rhodospirillaceae bacterium]|nr:MAG: polyketide cyclase [Rhodospirillaceae bacterium]